MQKIVVEFQTTYVNASRKWRNAKILKGGK